MRYFILFFLLIPTLAFADRVILLDENGKHIMTSPYSDTAIEAMKKDALSAKLDLSKVTIKRITEEEWKAIEQVQIIKPAQDLATQKTLEQQTATQAIKDKLKLTDTDIGNLQKVCK